jgi:hypothetical protein
MAVTIDIPGVGNVEAKNAASEATLREILKAMQGVEKKISGKKGGGGGGGNDPSADEPSSPASSLGKSMGKLSKAVMPVIGGFQAFGNALSNISNIIGNFANVGDSLERAAQQVPIFGGMLGTVAAASVRANDAFLSAARSGAGFGDDLNEFARSASAAGMTLDKFGSFISSNSEGLIGLGSTVGQGVDNFTKISKTIRATGSDLFALGYSTEDINKGIANFGGLLRIQGRQGTMNNEQLAAASKNYMKEIDALAKATGEERGSIEAKMKQMAQDAQFSSFMSTKSTDVQNSFNSLITRMGPTLGNFAKDFITTGSLTSDATQKIGAMYGQETMAELQRLRNIALANQKATAADSDRAAGVLIKDSKRVQQQFGQVMAQSGGAFNDVANANIDANKLQADAMVNANAEQRKAAEEGKKFNEQLQKSQATLAKFSNDFTIALANSGLLDTLMKAFGAMATLVQTFVVPAFNILASIVGTAVNIFSGIVSFIGDNLTPIFHGLGVTLTILTAAYANQIISVIANTVSTAANSVAKAYNTVVTALSSVASSIMAAPFIAVAVAVGAVVALFVGLYRSGWSFGSVFEAVGDNLKRFGMTLMEFIDNIRSKLPPMFGGLSKDEVEAKKKEREQARKELDDREKARDIKREEVKKERGIETEKEKNAKKGNAVDAKIIADKKAAEDAKNKLDTNAGPEALLKQFAVKEGSPLIPKDKEPATAKAETTKKELEQKGEEKTAALKKAAEEQAKAEEKAKEDSKKEPPPKPATQESAESLLASLNTKMTELIKINKGTQAVSEQQLSVQKGMTSDLFAA